MKVVALIQARIGAKRLPGKVLLPITSRTLPGGRDTLRIIDAVFYAVFNTRIRDKIAICCPLGDEKEFSRRWTIAPDVPKDDCAGRLLAAARLMEADHFVRICADSPFIHPALIDLAVATHLAKGNKVTQLEGMPAGQQPQVYEVEHFALAYPNMTKEQREHCIVSPMPRALVNYKVKLTVDTQADYDRLKPLYESLPDFHWNMTWPDLFKAVR